MVTPLLYGRQNMGILAVAIVGGATIFWLVSALLGAPERVALAAILPRRQRG